MAQSDYARVEQAIQYLWQNVDRQPGLEDVAAHLGLSPHHFQRLFRRWAGISPKRFLQFLTVEYAKKLLEESDSVLDAAYAAGLSGPGRLHDHFVNVEAVTPGEFKNKGAGVRIVYGVHQSPFGDCFLAVTDRGICTLSFLGDSGEAAALHALRKRWPGAEVVNDVTATRPYFEAAFPREGKNGRRTIDLYVQGTNFQIKVWQALLLIPPGHVVSYEDVARQIGQPTAARAVGNAVAANPIGFLIPCHRVIRKNGLLGSYQWDAARKKAIFGWEAARRAEAL